MTCQSCLSSPPVCPCQPVACPLLPKTFRSAGTNTDRNVSATSGQLRRMTSKSDCMQLASRQLLADRRVESTRPESGSKDRSCDIGCGFVQFCHKHIFASPAAISSVSGRARKMSQNPVTVMSSQSQCDSFSSHFNPCYSSSSPPDDDDNDDINLDAVRLCDGICSSRTTKTRALPALPGMSEMSESCFESLKSSANTQVLDLPRLFRPLSWAGPVDSCLTDSGCSCSNQSAVSATKSEKWNLPGAQRSSPASHVVSHEQFVPLSAETPFYWELELPTDTNAFQTLLMPETCQKLASPLRMGTASSEMGNVFESSHVDADSKKLLPKKPPYENLGSEVGAVRAPKMGCLPAKCFVCRDCQHVCSACGINRKNPAESCSTPLIFESCLPRTCKCMKQRRCPTPPRMLFSHADDDDSLGVPVADI